MRPHPDELDLALPFVLQFKCCESRQEAEDKATRAIVGGLGVDLEQSQRILEDLEGLGKIQLRTRTAADAIMVYWEEGGGPQSQ